MVVHLLLFIIYISFISLGLPDGLLGAAWPSIRQELNLDLSMMGIVSLVISVGTVISSLYSDKICRKYGSGRVTAFSIALTAVGLIGTAFSRNLILLCLWAIPYGLGAGGVDACLNNYVAIHYSGKHMSWLHSMWGLGATAGPYLMGAVLASGAHWSIGYLGIGIGQAILVVVILSTLRIWQDGSNEQCVDSSPALSLRQILHIPGAKAVFLAFFCYCALEQTIGQWAGSYFFNFKQIDEDMAAVLAGVYYMGITFGRLINGFLTVRFTNRQLVRFGFAGVFMGLILMAIPVGIYGAVIGVVLTGLGSAPIYPCIIHDTPVIFGEDKSQAVIGVEMACAYVGICIMPPLFGVMAELVGIGSLPLVMLVVLGVMFFSHKRLYSNRG